MIRFQILKLQKQRFIGQRINKQNKKKDLMEALKNVMKSSILQKFQACMILSAVGDAMGYKNGQWQFLTNGGILHQSMMEITNGKGPLALKIDMSWKYSDDTVMHIATAEALLKQKKNLQDIDQVSKQMAVAYKISGTKMAGRAPGNTCMKSINFLNKNGDNWNKIPYNDHAGGCGGAMRSACIGLVFSKPQQVYDLIKTSIQAGRITHHNPIGYLGSMVASYFTALAIRGIAPKLWMGYLLEQAFPLSQKYIEQAKREVAFNLTRGSWSKYIQGCKKYSQIRKLQQQIGKQECIPYFPQVYGIKQREQFYSKISFARWPGATGFDSIIIAYDALLGCKGNWEEFCLRGILHGGDNDSTGAIGAAWFGAMYGYNGVPKNHYQALEDNKKLQQLGQSLHKIASL